MTSEPRTEAGRRLFTDNEPGDMLESNGVTWGDVAAIEDEARSLALSEVEAALAGHIADLARIEDNPGFAASPDYYGGLGIGQDALADVLATITALREGTGQ